MEGLPAELRRERILELLDRTSFLKVGDLTAEFGLSGVTIRNDLDALAETGSLVRVHGGAISPTTSARRERPYEEVADERPDEKAAIGRVIAGIADSGDTLYLDVGTTATAVARALVARADLEDLVVITAGLATALELETAIPRFSVVVTGGTLRPLQHSLVDPLADLVFDRVRADIAVIGCNGVDAIAGVTNVNIPEAAIKARMVEASERTIVAADGAKLGNRSVTKICDLDAVQMVVTSHSAPPDAVASIRDTETIVEIADSDG